MPRPPKHAVRLTAADRRRLDRLIRAGTAPARTLTHARILLKADTADGGSGWTDADIATALDCGGGTSR